MAFTGIRWKVSQVKEKKIKLHEYRFPVAWQPDWMATRERNSFRAGEVIKMPCVATRKGKRKCKR